MLGIEIFKGCFIFKNLRSFCPLETILLIPNKLNQPETDIMVQFLGPETDVKSLFLGPEIVKMVQQNFWPQKLTKWFSFWDQKLT